MMPATTPLVQLKVVPAVVLVGLYVTAVLLQISAMIRGLERTGVGFTVMVKLLSGPWQSSDPLLNEGVTVMVAVIGEFPAFVAVNEKGPVPSDPSPMAVLLFVQE